MTTNLGQLLKQIEVLDEAASRAALDRNTTLTVIATSQQLRTDLQELYKQAGRITRLNQMEHALIALLPELDVPTREKLAKLLPPAGSAPAVATPES